MNNIFAITPETTHEERKEHIYKMLFLNIMRMDKKMADRDNTIMLALPYENFEEFYQDNKHWFIVKFSKSSLLFNAIIRNYLRSQISCVINNDMENRDGVEIVLNLIFEIVNDNLDELIGIISQKYPGVHKEIEELNTNGI